MNPILHWTTPKSIFLITVFVRELIVFDIGRSSKQKYFDMV